MSVSPRSSITCPKCGFESRNPYDVAEGYCGSCLEFTQDPHSFTATDSDARPKVRLAGGKSVFIR